MLATATPAQRDIDIHRTIPAAREMRPNLALLGALTEARAFGIPQYAVASCAEISPAMLSMVARGRLRPTAKTAHAIARALGRPARELFPAAACEKEKR